MSGDGAAAANIWVPWNALLAEPGPPGASLALAAEWPQP